mmetsp:Transcript_16962/g.41673  ORF Transcript_16962/g.41673 Transcript_16962/m.41673 type:complete len:114 (-) Transcript_16962:911-1252(-)
MDGEMVRLLPGAVEVILLFLGTVMMTACFHSYAHLPPVLGMMTGLGLLKVYGWWKSRSMRCLGHNDEDRELGDMGGSGGGGKGGGGNGSSLEDGGGGGNGVNGGNCSSNSALG